VNHKEIALGAFVDIEGAFDNISFMQLIRLKESRELRLIVGGSVPFSITD
jgi:hypothetical protein